jgi:hypothetical protein
MQNQSVLALLGMLVASALAAPLSAQIGPQCPNACATNIPARVEHNGPSVRCGLGVQVLGLPISIGGAKCYKNEILYPAHQECLGAHNAGTACVPAGNMPVALNRCECLLVGVLGTGIAAPKCNCESAGTLGTVEDAETVLCHITR